MPVLSGINFLSEDKYNNISRSEDELYLVNTKIMRKLCSVVQATVAVSSYYTLTLPTPLPEDLSKVVCNIYARVKTANNNWAVGDIIPIQGLWGKDYRSITCWFNRTQCGFSTSNQLTVINKNVADTTVSVNANFEIHFDFYEVE